MDKKSTFVTETFNPPVVAVYLTSDPSAKRAVDIAYHEVKTTGGKLHAFYVNTPEMSLSSSKAKDALENLVNYACSLGAHISVLNGSDPKYLIGEFCRNNSVDLLVLNRPAVVKGLARFRPTFAQQVAAILPETRLMTVPGTMTIHASHIEPEKRDLRTNVQNFFLVALIIALTTLLCYILDNANVDEFIQAQIFILGVLVCSVSTGSVFWSLVSAMACDLLIAQVVSNLVTNSIHHTPDGTPIKIRTYAEEDMAVVEVSDEGLGIKDSMKDRIFDIFYTGDAPSFDSTHYLGLGLFLCKAILDAHNGIIEVHDNKPRGSVFSFRIPLLSIA